MGYLFRILEIPEIPENLTILDYWTSLPLLFTPDDFFQSIFCFSYAIMPLLRPWSQVCSDSYLYGYE